jgi:AGCS family alanine or glycine:cation symporter
MFESLLAILETIDNYLWGYIGVPAIILLGIYFTLKSKFIQIRKMPYIIKHFFILAFSKESHTTGVHPIKTFFTSMSGCTGIGNIVAICTAIQIGGPGALFWIWITAIVGMIIKYAEVYLGLHYRITHHDGSYSGGPMFFLQKVFKGTFIPKFACVLLCIYGVEIYQFNVVTTSITDNFSINRYLVTLVLLATVIGIGSGGVRRVGSICSRLIPVFIVCYMGMGYWVLAHNIFAIPSVLKQIFISAFTGHAAVGAFAGSGIMLAISQGMRRGCYTGDVGVGYASVIHSESSISKPEKQAMLAIFDIFIDSFLICTTSVMLVLVTGLWKEPIPAIQLVQSALAQYFPYMHYFMPIFLLLLGYTTIITYFCAGLKCAKHLSPMRGHYYFYLYASASLLLFSFISTSQALIVMSITGALLLTINLFGIFHLRHKIAFHFDN